MTFLGKLDKWTRKLEETKQQIAEALFGKTEKAVTGRRALHQWWYCYGIEEMADVLKKEKKSFFQTKGGTRYAIATRTVTKKGLWGRRVTKEVPTNFVRVLKDPRTPKLRKRLRREARFAQLRAIASVGLRAAAQPIS